MVVLKGDFRDQYMSKNVGEMLKELQLLKTEEQATRYLIKELQENSNVWTNIKYITGYLGNEERNRIIKLFRMERL